MGAAMSSADTQTNDAKPPPGMPSCHGYCQQGRWPCSTPWACELPEPDDKADEPPWPVGELALTVAMVACVIGLAVLASRLFD